MPQISTLIYLTDEWQNITYDTNQTCEGICLKICRSLEITPACVLLFSLRISDTNVYLPCSRKILPNKKYEFRFRYQVNNRKTILFFLSYLYFICCLSITGTTNI